MIVRKEKQERLLTMMSQLIQNTSITQLSPGSIARSFLDIINEQLEEYYIYLETYVPMAFLSSAEGKYIDLLGSLLNCTRKNNESDDNYKYRISNYVYSVAGANETAIYIACLSVEGVKDVMIVPFSYGIGSFSVYVVTDDPNIPDEVINGVQVAIEKTKALGIKGVAERPNVRRLNLAYKLYFDTNIDSNELSNISRAASLKIKSNIDNTIIGQKVYIDKMLTDVVDISDKLMNIEILDVQLDGKTVYSNIIALQSNEKVYAGTITSS